MIIGRNEVWKTKEEMQNENENGSENVVNIDKWIEIEKPDNEEKEEDPTMWKPITMKDYRIGTLNEKNTEVGKFPNSVLYIFDGDPENPPDHRDVWKIWGSANLNGYMKDIKIGDRIIVQYIDSHPTKKGNPWKEFRVLLPPEGGEEASASSSSTIEKPVEKEETTPPVLDMTEPPADIVHEAEATDKRLKTIETEDDEVAIGMIQKLKLAVMDRHTELKPSEVTKQQIGKEASRWLVANSISDDVFQRIEIQLNKKGNF